MDALKGSWQGQPKDNMKSALVFEAVVCWAAVPLPLALGWIGGKGSIKLGRSNLETENVSQHGSSEEHSA